MKKVFCRIGRITGITRRWYEAGVAEWLCRAVSQVIDAGVQIYLRSEITLYLLVVLHSLGGATSI